MYLHDHPSLQLEDVKEGVHTETIVGQKRYESEIVNIDQKRANTEDAFNDEVALKYLNDGMPNPSKHEQMIKDIVRSREKEEFSKMTLKLLLAINGYSFDFDQYEKDLYTDIKAEENRPTDASRSSKHLIARERLDNPTEYLSTIVKPK
ncbi:hypothetical protein FD37_GL002268 [Levilactobacillus spicheri DSM 15429]|nr:hypothetical protein FD37_GL002268 [Levilactobacillus spicheri DSM 15429]